MILSSFVMYLLYISVVRLKNETTAQSHCAKEYIHNDLKKIIKIYEL